MYKAVTIILCVVYICVLPLSSQAQVNIVVGGQNYHISNVKDNNINPSLNQFVKDRVVQSIQQSKYEIEIRQYISGEFPGEGRCIVIRGSRDNLEAIDYFVHTFSLMKTNGKFQDSGRVLHQYDYPGQTQRLGIYITTLKPTLSLSVLLQQLVTAHINDVPGSDELVAILNKNGVFPEEVRCNDCYSAEYYEVKIGEHYRSFTINNNYKTNKLNYPELTYQRQIEGVFNSLIVGL